MPWLSESTKRNIAGKTNSLLEHADMGTSIGNRPEWWHIVGRGHECSKMVCI